MSATLADPDIIWRPDPDVAARSAMRRFMDFAAARSGRRFADYAALHRWSVEDRAAFWGLLAEFAGVRFHAPPDTVLANGEAMPGARWFPGARLNFAEHLLAGDGGPAFVFGDEAGRRREFDRPALRHAVAAIAAGLERAGVQPGDRVAGLLPNGPEAVVAMLAAASLGATWSSCSPDFGAAGVIDRLGQVRPRVLFAADGYRYAGKRIDVRPVLREVIEGLEDLAATVMVPFLEPQPDIGGLPGAVAWDDFAEPGAPLRFAALPFDHPLYILFSSGTTGVPKAIVHGAGGALLQHLKEHLLHLDLDARDRLFFFTTCGWMMWNWLVSALATGASIVLYDGSPLHPDPGVLWRLAEREGVTVFGASARYLGELQRSDYVPAEHHALGAVRTVLSTGSPLSPEGFDFAVRALGRPLPVCSISGGTDIVSCFALGNPLLPVRRGELQCAALGMDVAVFDEAGGVLVGERGELVCRRAFPSLPLGFLDDPHGARYHAAYFERFANTWAHGDFAVQTETGGFVIHGRSDAVLNPGGVRIGTAEIYRQVERVAEIADAIAVAQDWRGDQRIVLFVVPRPGIELDDELRERIRQAIRRHASPRHVPAKILAVPAVPRTRSGKLTELAVRDVIHGRPVKNTAALANPEALDAFRDRPELTAR